MRCPHFNCTLSVNACVIRQGMAKKPNNNAMAPPSPYMFCINCETGALARKEKLGDGDVARLAAESMEQRAESKTEKQETWIPDQVRDDGGREMAEKLKCSRCGQMKEPEQFGPDKKAANHGFRRYYCKPCEVEAQRERQKKRIGETEKRGRAGVPKDYPIDERPAKLPERLRLRPRVQTAADPEKKPVLILDFSPCLPVLVKIEEVAGQELRTPANQCLVFLRELLKEIEGKRA